VSAEDRRAFLEAREEFFAQPLRVALLREG
jgi:hypothetical protein